MSRELNLPYLPSTYKKNKFEVIDMQPDFKNNQILKFDTRLYII